MYHCVVDRSLYPASSRIVLAGAHRIARCEQNVCLRMCTPLRKGIHREHVCRMPGLDGFGVLNELRRGGETTPVIVYTGTGNYERCVRAIKLGAYGFIDKSEPMERVVREIENAVERQALASEVRALKDRLGDDSPLIWESPPMKALRTGAFESVAEDRLFLDEIGELPGPAQAKLLRAPCQEHVSVPAPGRCPATPGSPWSTRPAEGSGRCRRRRASCALRACPADRTSAGR